MDTIDTFDNRLKYYHFLLCRDNLDNLPDYPLPAGYRFVFTATAIKRIGSKLKNPPGNLLMRLAA